MFQNSFQNGSYFELYDPKIAQDKIKNLFKITNVHGNNKVFDKDLKTYVLQFTSSTSKITFPKEEKKDLYMIQQYLVFQIYFYPGMAWNMELVVSDLTKTKRRIILSPTSSKIQIKPFFVKFPCINFKEGIWNNFAVDLYSFMEAFKGQTYRSLDNIYINGNFKLRRIYSTNTIPIQTQEEQEHIQSFKTISFLPKNFYFAPGVPYCTKLTKYDGDINISHANLYQPTQPSTKNNSSYLKSTKNRLSTPKTETVKSQKIVQSVENKLRQKEFLANTNGPQMMNRQRRQKYHQSSDSQSQITENNNKTPQSSEKGIVKKKLIKTQQMPPKVRSSIEKKSMIQQKQKTKAKLNPWRNNAKRSETSKIEKKNINQQSDRNIQSPQTSLFKTNQKNKFNQSINKGFDRKSDHYSQSEYIQLSQKFSTLTDGKFFKNQSNQPSYLNEHHLNQEHNQDQIQQNIQMQSNSMYSSSNRKQQKPQMILESICDSLDRKSPKKDFEVVGRASYYGFAQRLMNQYMGDRERPYSPPMIQRQRQPTEQEEFVRNKNNQKQEVELVYDPVLNCYYDHKTHTYYELKN